jgi:hypothetical protein
MPTWPASTCCLAGVTEVLKVRPDEAPERVEALVTRLRDAEKELQRLQAEKVLQAAPQLAQQAADLAGTRFVGAHVGEVGGDDVRSLVLDVRARLGDRAAVVALTAVAKGRPLVVVATNEAAARRGCPRVPSSRPRQASSAGAGAASRTWPRAAARTRPRSRRLSRRCAARWPRPSGAEAAVGARLAVDVGSVRIGVAVSDPRRTVAVPLDTVARGAGGSDLRAIAAIAVERRWTTWSSGSR